MSLSSLRQSRKTQLSSKVRSLLLEAWQYIYCISWHTLTIYCLHPELSGLSAENLVFPWTNRLFAPFKHGKNISFIFTFNITKKKKKTLLFSRMTGGSNKTLEYFQLLGRERMQKLYQIFRIDFEMFDYSIDSYERLFLWLCYIKSCETTPGMLSISRFHGTA